MRVVGTAGHVDHGKSTLITALTGIDPDRLREEKERGMTIDLGFAWLRLPDGQEISIIDVPGHERFVHNMLAGVGGIDLALLVVAADEGIMPQTREHLAILDLLGISRGVVALTKRDLVDDEWLELVRAEVEETLAGTSLAGAPLVACSALTGEGLDDLVQTLQRLLAQPRARPDTGRPRLPIDRVFTAAGFGTVVTGTLIDGELRVGQEVEVQPGGRRSRVRGLQSHKKKVELARAGTRVAVNLVGLATEELKRGDVLTAPGWLQPTRTVDARLRTISPALVTGPTAAAIAQGEPLLVHNAEVTFHTGAAETVGRVALLDRPALKAGESGWVQLRLAKEVAVAKGDLFVIRQPSPPLTIGGGTIVEPHPRRHRRFQAAVLQTLAVLERGSPEEIVLQQLRAREPADVESLLRRSGLAGTAGQAAIGTLVARREIVALDGRRTGDDPTKLSAQTLVLTRGGWERFVERLRAVLDAYHRAYPLRQGMPKEEARARVGADARFFARAVVLLEAEGLVREVGPFLALAEHRVEFNAQQQAQVAQLLAALRAAGWAPPARQELIERFDLDPDLIAVLVERGELVELTPELLYPRDVYAAMVEQVVEAIKARGPITVAGIRDLFGTSRKYALALAGHLDERRITRRVGDDRVLY